MVQMDPLTAYAAASTVALAVTFAVAHRRKVMMENAERDALFYRERLANQTSNAEDLLVELEDLRRHKRARLEHCQQAGKKGRAVQLARAAERKVEKQADAAERAKRTLAEMASTTMRSRAQVVAPVKAARTRKKNAESGAGAVAATKG